MRVKVFNKGSLSKSLEHAFLLFKEFCKQRGKTTSITEFSLKTLKAESFPGLKGHVVHYIVLIIYGLGFRV